MKLNILPKTTTQTFVYQIIYHFLAIIYKVFTFLYNKSVSNASFYSIPKKSTSLQLTSVGLTYCLFFCFVSKQKKYYITCEQII